MAQAASDQGGVYRTMDGGDSWERINSSSDHPIGYFAQIRSDPKDRNRVYRMALRLYISDDMGRTYRPATGLHGDWHDLWVDPLDPNHLLAANDGGLGISWDRGVTWGWRTNIPTSQFWEMDVDTRDPYWICAGTQDNGNWCTPSAVRNRNGVSNRDAFSVGGGDGMHFHIDPRDTTYGFIEVNSESTTNSIQRLDLANLQRQGAKPGVGRPLSCFGGTASAGGQGTASAASTAGRRGFGTDPSYRWAWDTPVLFSAVTPGVVYSAANVLFKSTDRGGSWKPISPDLTTRVDRDTIYIMGKAVGAVNYSPGASLTANPLLTSLFGTITWIGESPLNGRVLYVGTDDGQVQVTRDGGATWANVTARIPGLPPFTMVSSVLASRFVAGRVYATFDGHFSRDNATYVYVSNDFGQSWRAITTGLPAMTPVTRIAEHPRDANVLAVGHARGVHFSNDGGATWQSLMTNMPTVPVRALVFQARDNALIAGTYARGAWILDDVGPLQALTAEGVKSDALLVSITRGREWDLFSLGPTYGEDVLYAPNPEFDPAISYYVRDGATGTATITISDAQGARVRTLHGPVARGLNRVTWDMHMDSALPEAEAAAGRGGRGGGGGGGGRGGAGSGGPLVLPGKYAVTITIPGLTKTLRGDLTVQADPLDAAFSATDRRARQDTLMLVYGLQKTLVSARTAARSLAGQADAIRQDLTRGGASGAASKADELADRLTRLQAEAERLLGITNSLLRAIEAFNSVPTTDQHEQLAWAFDDATRAVTTLNRTSQADIPALYTQFAKGTQARVAAPVALPAAPAPRKP
jgi:photosystem II stability/assembly factor-like uncharacterized protein